MSVGNTCTRILSGLAAVLFWATLPSSAAEDVRVSVAPTLTTDQANEFYVGNRKPLTASPLVKLPVGNVEPRGWLREQLVLEGDGMTGHLTELSKWCKFEGSAWASPKGVGENGWEELPYWIKGYIALGAVLKDKRILDESKKWLDAILAGQESDGYIGPQANKKEFDLWPNMPVLYALRTYYEVTGDKQILEALKKYFKWQMTLPADKFLAKSWQQVRACDNLDVVYWLYNVTGESWLLDLAEKNHKASSPWVKEIASRHGVNFAQCFREPGQYYQQTHSAGDLKAAERNYDEYYGQWGQVPGGMFGADENARPGYISPRQGAETCALVEMMYSAEMLMGITGQVLWGDRCEDVAFNSLPASMTPDLKSLHYVTCPNQVQLDRANKAPMIQNAGDMMTYSPYEHYRCCQHNVAFGWPYLAERLWMATPGNGLAATFYAACSVKAKVGDGTEITIEETTDYPFGDLVAIKIDSPKSVRFPLSFRIPGWCNGAFVTINGQGVGNVPKAGQWITLDRAWQKGDVVELRLPMEVKLRTWAANAHSVSVDRGPLTYSLKIGQKWQSYMDPEAKDQPKRIENWPCWEAFSTTPWNYALIVDAQAPEKSFAFGGTVRPIKPQPFTPEAAPISLTAKARKVPAWKMEANGLIGMLPSSPVPADQLASETEDVTLIPMGCTRIRVSAFPVAAPGTN